MCGVSSVIKYLSCLIFTIKSNTKEDVVKYRSFRMVPYTPKETARLKELRAKGDKTWAEVAVALNIEFHNAKKVRTVAALKKIMWKNRGTLAPEPDETVAPIDPVRDQQKKDELGLLRKQLKETHKEQAFQALILQAIGGSSGTLKTPPAMPTLPTSKKKTNTTIILNLNDHHANREIDPSVVEGMDAYDFDIYARRLWSVIRRTISISRAQYCTSNRITGLSIYYLGDIGNDSQRKSSIATNEMAENSAAIVTAHINAQAIDALLRATSPDGATALFPKIRVVGLPGNEPRFDQKINFAQPWRNWDWVIYQFLSAFLGSAEGRVEYCIPNSMALCVEELGWLFLLSHGYEIRSNYRVPYYGFAMSNAKEQFKRKSRGGFDYRITAHFHVSARIPENCRAHYVCPPLVGTDGYASALGYGTTSGQLLLAVTKKTGVISEHIVYADETEASPFRYNIDLAVGGAFRAMEEWRKTQ